LENLPKKKVLYNEDFKKKEIIFLLTFFLIKDNADFNSNDNDNDTVGTGEESTLASTQRERSRNQIRASRSTRGMY
jgi:hypothetical protein